jgi:hypothetical protein
MHMPLLLMMLSVVLVGTVLTQAGLECDVLPTAAGDLKITFIGHASLMFSFNGKVFHVDPCGTVGMASGLAQARKLRRGSLRSSLRSERRLACRP